MGLLIKSLLIHSIHVWNYFINRNKKNGAVLARSSQPEVGVFGWRCNEDEKLLSSIARSALLNSWAHDPLGLSNALIVFDVFNAYSLYGCFSSYLLIGHD